MIQIIVIVIIIIIIVIIIIIIIIIIVIIITIITVIVAWMSQFWNCTLKASSSDDIFTPDRSLQKQKICKFSN